MKLILKYTAIILAGLVGLLIVLIIALKSIPDDQYKSWISAAVKSSTGRELAIESLQLDFGSAIRIRANAVQLANADWAEQANMLTFNQLEAELKTLPLLLGKAEIRLLIDGADVLVQRNENELSNWDMAVDSPPEAIPDQQGFNLWLQPILREIRLDDMRLALFSNTHSSPKTALLKHLLIETPELESTLLLEADVDSLTLMLSANVGDINAALQQSSTPININGSFDHNEFKISGDWGPVSPDLNLNVVVDLQAPSTSSITNILGYEVEDLGLLKSTARARAIDGQFSLEEITTTLDGEQISGSITGAITNLGPLANFDIAVKLNTVALDGLLKGFNIDPPVPMPPEVELSAQIHSEENRLNINNIKAFVGDEGMAFSLTGGVKDLLTSRQLDGQFTASADSLSKLSKYVNRELPALGALTLSGKVQSKDKVIGLQALDIKLTADNLKLNVVGQIDDLLTVDGINAKLDADISSLTKQNIAELTNLLKAFKLELLINKLPQSLKLSSNIQGNLEQLSLNDIDTEVIDKGIKISLSGEVQNLLDQSGISAMITLHSDSVASFSKFVGTTLPDLGPLDATAKVVSNGQTFRLEKLQAKLTEDTLQADLNGSIDDLLAISGINAKLTANIDSLASLSEIAKTKLPATDPIKMQASFRGENLEQAKVVLAAQSAGVKVTLDGQLLQLKAAEDLQMNVSVQANKLSDFDQFALTALPDLGPLDLAALIRIQPGSYDFSDLKVQLDDQSATGNIIVKRPEVQNQPVITVMHGQLDIAYLDLSPLLPESQTEDAEEDTAPTFEAETTDARQKTDETIDESLQPSERLLSSEPILFDLLHDYDIDLALNANKINFGKSNVQNLLINILLKDGLLNVSPINGTGGIGGTIDGNIQIDGRSSPPALTVTIRLDQMPMPNIGGNFDFNMDLDGKGLSIAELMASLEGQILAVMKDGVIEKSIASRFGSGLLSFSKDKTNTQLECLILRVDIVDGVADFKNKLAAQLTEVTWRGGGTVDFNTEKLSADIVPKPRKGIPISVGGNLAGLVKLGGTLKNPKVIPDYSDVALKYGKYSAYVATGGLSLLAEVIANKITANQDVCAKILDGTVFAEAE